MSLEDIIEMTTVTVKLIVAFAKRIHGFMELQLEDQISLLKVQEWSPKRPCMSVWMNEW